MGAKYIPYLVIFKLFFHKKEIFRDGEFRCENRFIAENERVGGAGSAPAFSAQPAGAGNRGSGGFPEESGDRVEFDRNGAWTEVKCRSGQAVPAAIVPEPIQNYVHDWDATVAIVGIERDQHSYEVQLSNRWELTFDRNFNVIDIDD